MLLVDANLIDSVQKVSESFYWSFVWPYPVEQYHDLRVWLPGEHLSLPSLDEIDPLAVVQDVSDAVFGGHQLLLSLEQCHYSVEMLLST